MSFVAGEMPEVQRQEVRFVHIECPGFATVKFDTSSTECSIEFGTGTVINAYPSGSYDIYHQDGGYLQVCHCYFSLIDLYSV